jgi:hypothetical protein
MLNAFIFVFCCNYFRVNNPEISRKQETMNDIVASKFSGLDDSERFRTTVAFGVELGSGEAITRAAVQELELTLI